MLHGMAMNAGTYKAPVTGRTAKKPFFTAKTPKGPGDHMEAPFVRLPLQLSPLAVTFACHTLILIAETNLCLLQLLPDRFEAPVASIHFNSLGEE